jgi:hypothetical protein
MQKQIYVLAVGIFLPLVFCASIAAQDEVLKTSICEITTEPRQFVGKIVEVDAVMYSGFEMGWLRELSDCACVSKLRFDYRYGEDYERDTSSKTLKKIKKILSRKIANPTDINKYRGNFTLRLLEYKRRNDFDTRFDYIIEIVKVDSVVKVN